MKKEEMRSNESKSENFWPETNEKALSEYTSRWQQTATAAKAVHF